MTQKIDPDDVDVVLAIPVRHIDSGTVMQIDSIKWFATYMGTSHKVHGFVSPQCPKGHPSRGASLWREAYWIRQFGVARSGIEKGMAVLKLA